MLRTWNRLGALLLALALTAGLTAPAALGAEEPPTTTHTYTLESPYVYSDLGPVTVTVTLDGYIGSLDAAACGLKDEMNAINGWTHWRGTETPDSLRDILVLTQGSKVTFTITGDDPDAAYNFCYDPASTGVGTVGTGLVSDECGGGVVYRPGGGGSLANTPLTLTASLDGSVTFYAGSFMVGKGHKLTEDTYAYTMQDGLYTLTFNAKARGSMDAYGYTARYVLGTFLVISSDQAAQLADQGTVTFHEIHSNKFESMTYSHAYPGLAELLAAAGEKPAPDYTLNGTQPTDWALEEVSAAVDRGLLPPLTGEPGYQSDVTRRQFAQLAVRLVETVTGAELEAAPEGTFPDCDDPAVRKAYAAGIVQGTDEGLFLPDATTDREQIALMVLRTVGLLEGFTATAVVERTGSLENFADRDEVSFWAAAELGVMAHNGLLEGGDGKIYPHRPCTVEQSLMMLYRVYLLFA